MVEKKGMIVGIKDIGKYINRSESTVLIWVRDKDFPAQKNDKENIWEAKKKDIDAWLKKQKISETGFSQKPRQKKKNRGRR